MTNEEMQAAIRALPREGLEEIALFAVGGLWGNGNRYDANKDVRGSDFIDHMSDVLGRQGLTPAEDPQDDK